MSRFTPNGLDETAAKEAITQLEDRLVACIDLQLTLKHIHWNVLGPNFVGVHEMLDEQTAAVREMTDEIAERIATLGGEPTGTPGFVVNARSWNDYSVGRAPVQDHLEALDSVYTGVITDHRKAIDAVSDVDPVTEDLLVAHTGKLELLQWFVRSQQAVPAP